MHQKTYRLKSVYDLLKGKSGKSVWRRRKLEWEGLSDIIIHIIQNPVYTCLAIKYDADTFEEKQCLKSIFNGKACHEKCKALKLFLKVWKLETLSYIRNLNFQIYNWILQSDFNIRIVWIFLVWFKRALQLF